MKNKKQSIKPLNQAIITCLALTTLPIQAATFTVLNSNDAGTDSLRAAIILANTTAGADIINFDAGLDNAIITLTTGQINISDPASSLHIDASALTNGITISGDNMSRVLAETEEQALTLTNLTITAGQTSANSINETMDCSDLLNGFTRGGGICAEGDLTLIDTHITNNHTLGKFAQGGGFITQGNVTITNSVISDNTVEGLVSYGGGFAVTYNDNTVTITNSEISSNKADNGQGGGFYLYVGSHISITDSTISDNTAKIGGGFTAYSGSSDIVITNNIITNNQALGRSSGGFKAGSFGYGTVTISKSFISNNQSVLQGGGFYSFYSTEIIDTVISNNQTTSNQGYGGGFYTYGSILTVTNSIISNNKSLGNDSQGGGIYVHGYNSTGGITITINNSTISKNSTLGSNSGGGGLYIYTDDTAFINITNSTISGNSTSGTSSNGGGINVAGIPDLTIDNSTITQNTATDTSSLGDGLFIDTNNDITLSSTILSANEDDNFTMTGFGDLNSNNSLFGDLVTEITGTNLNNIITNSPSLIALADNGCAVPAGAVGNTSCVQTHQLLASSLALNSGDDNGFTTDQRGTGFARVLSSSADIGAFEGIKTSVPVFAVWEVLKTLIIDN